MVQTLPPEPAVRGAAASPIDETIEVTVEANPDPEDTLDSQANPGDNGNEPGPASEVMEVTPDHPIYVEGKGWSWAENLAVGDRLRRADGGWASVSVFG